MSKRVVDGLESIQIKEQQRHQLVLPFSSSYRLVETVQQQTAIRKAGQLVVICELARLCPCFAQQGNLLLKKRLLCPQLIDQAKGSFQPLLAGRKGVAERCCVRRRQRGSLPGRVRGSVFAAGEEFRGLHELLDHLVQPFDYWNQVLIPQRRAQ